GNDATNANDTTGALTTVNLGNIEYTSGDVKVTLSVGDGQYFADGDLTVNGATVGSNLFRGTTGQLRSMSSDSLWDVVEIDITSQLNEGDNSVVLVNQTDQDCLQFVSVIV